MKTHDRPKRRLINAYDLEKYTAVRDGHKYVPWLAISEVPTAETVIHSRWVKTDYKPMIFTKCALCGYRVEIQNKSPFCPGCGAKMDGWMEGSKMDYKKLIERLEYYGTTYAVGDSLGRMIDGSDEVMLDAATAIKSLLAEQDRMLKDLRYYGSCNICKHRKDDFPCAKCRNLDCWQWLGTKTGEAGGTDG